jgi:VWFA-related protein
MSVRTIAVTTALLLATLSGQAQDVVFRSGVDLVTVDATVVGSDGRPLADLIPADFLLKVDGRPRRVLSAEFIPSAAPTTRVPSVPARHFTSNEYVDAGRLIVVAVDQMQIRRLEGRPAAAAAARFLDSLDPLDHVAVTSLDRIARLTFTRDRFSLKRRLETLTGQGDPVFLQYNLGLAEATEIADGSRSRLADAVLRECGRSLVDYINPNRAADESGGRDPCPEQVEQEARAMAQQARTQANISLSALQALVDGLKALDGPKTIVLLSEGLVLDPRLVNVSELAARAHDARVSIHTLLLETPIFEAAQERVSPSLLRDFEMRGEGLSRLAGATRGTSQRLVGSDPAPFQRISRELSGYYLLAFEADSNDRDGRIHRIDVGLTRGGARVLARPAFRMPVVRPSMTSRQQTLEGLLRQTDPATELPVRVATYAYPEPESDRLRIVVSTEAEGRTVAAAVLMGYVLTDQRGVIVASGAQEAVSGRHAFSTLVPRGEYMLRVAGIDPLGRKGRVERPFVAAIEERAGVRASDLILAPVPAPDRPLHPLVDRVTGPRIVAYLEMQSLDAEGLRGAEMQVEIVDEQNGRVRLTAPATVTNQTASWSVVRTELSLVGLDPARYLARALVKAGDREIARVARPFTYDP